MSDYARHSRAVQKDRRWPALRLAAKRRDEFKCRECGAVGRLEVHHIKRVRDYPELAFELSNLKTLCVKCHSAETRKEVGLATELNPDRLAWKQLIRDLSRKEKVYA